MDREKTIEKKPSTDHRFRVQWESVDFTLSLLCDFCVRERDESLSPHTQVSVSNNIEDLSII